MCRGRDRERRRGRPPQHTAYGCCIYIDRWDRWDRWIASVENIHKSIERPVTWYNSAAPQTTFSKMIAQLNQPSLKGLKQKRNTTAIEEPGFIGGLLYWSCIIFFFQLEPKHATPQNAYPDIMWYNVERDLFYPPSHPDTRESSVLKDPSCWH